MPSPLHTALALLTVSAITIALRATPFLLFGGRRQLPPAISRLATLLPAAIMAILVVYCLKHVQPAQPPHGVPELAALTLVIVLHCWQRHVLLSIGAGTAFYMLLIRILPAAA